MSNDAEALRRMAVELENLERMTVHKNGEKSQMVIVPDWFVAAYTKALRGIAGRITERRIK